MKITNQRPIRKYLAHQYPRKIISESSSIAHGKYRIPRAFLLEITYLPHRARISNARGKSDAIQKNQMSVPYSRVRLQPTPTSSRPIQYQATMQFVRQVNECSRSRIPSAKLKGKNHLTQDLLLKRKPLSSISVWVPHRGLPSRLRIATSP